MTRFRITSLARTVLLAAGLAAGWGAAPARAQTIVTLFDVRDAVVSPNDEDDQATVRYTLSVVVDTLSLVIFEADSVTAVDTLHTAASEPAGGPKSKFWDGKRWDGSDAAEGAYVVTLFVRKAGNPDFIRSLPVFVDVTPPTVQILSALPSPYA
ncbi:MAG TPA: hypothetical protein VEC56_09920, partial [Candidatus Krumholzibacteria bacterium]|nr:hypothetical protein [Candidatus Krumholzibacteria bacterium]